MRSVCAAVLATVLAAALALTPGCGYSAGIHLADRMRSVGVTFFGNDTYERDLERPLQDEITRAVRTLTDVPIEDPARAEVLLRGTVTEFRRRDGIRSPDNKLLETGVYLEVEAALVDRRSDRALGPPKRAGSWIGYVLDDPTNAVEARSRALRHVADQLVLDLFSPIE